MNLNRKNIGKIRGLILFTALMVLGLMKFDLLCSMVVFLVGILRPFIVGGMIAFSKGFSSEKKRRRQSRTKSF